MSFYEIDYGMVVSRHTPVRLRKPRRLAWLRTLVSGIVGVEDIASEIEGVYDKFMSLRADANYYLVHNSQVCYMEAVLNDTFDNTLRRIYITDGPFVDPIYTYLTPEDHAVPLAADDAEIALPPDYDAPAWLYTDFETGVLGVQFIVYFPYAIWDDDEFDIDRAKALIGKYRLPSKRNYQLVPYTP